MHTCWYAWPILLRQEGQHDSQATSICWIKSQQEQTLCFIQEFFSLMWPSGGLNKLRLQNPVKKATLSLPVQPLCYISVAGLLVLILFNSLGWSNSKLPHTGCCGSSCWLLVTAGHRNVIEVIVRNNITNVQWLYSWVLSLILFFFFLKQWLYNGQPHSVLIYALFLLSELLKK